MPQNSNITLLDAAEIKVRFNDNEVLKEASLTIRIGDHLGMVGRNGSGKSTFLKILTEVMQPDSGNISRRNDLVIGYLSQDLVMAEDATVESTIREGAKHIYDLLEKYESLPADSNIQSELEQQISANDAWNIDTRILSLIHI